jgi:DNA-binding NarL/FixJ family response regulator
MVLLEQVAPDLLLVGLGLSDGAAIDVISHASTAWPRCDIMACTTFGEEGDVLRAIEAGAHGYLLKDSNAATILCELRNLHRGGSPISPLIARRILARFRPATMSRALSEREMKTLECITQGYTADEIARRTAVPPHTVLADIRHVYAMLKLPQRVQSREMLRGYALLAQ